MHHHIFVEEQAIIYTSSYLHSDEVFLQITRTDLDLSLNPRSMMESTFCSWDLQNSSSKQYPKLETLRFPLKFNLEDQSMI